MIRLKFQTFQDVHSATVGPAVAFRVAGNFLRQSPGDQVVGQYGRHQWVVQNRSFSRYDCLDPCCVFFTDAEGTRSTTFGPFRELFVADGTMYTDTRLFAKFIDESVLWHSFELETWWPSLVIMEPPLTSPTA
jgi:hypothetical protein